MELLHFHNRFYSFNLLSLVELGNKRVWISYGILCVHICVLGCTYARTHASGGQVNFGCLPQVLTTKTGSLTEPGTSWLICAGQWTPGTPVHASCSCVPSTGITGVFCPAGETRMNSGPQACGLNSLLTVPQPSEGLLLTSVLFAALKAVSLSLVWWCTPITSALGSQILILWLILIWGQTCLPSKFQAVEL